MVQGGLVSGGNYILDLVRDAVCFVVPLFYALEGGLRN